MDKQLLNSFVKKYYLEGKTKDALWSAKNGTIYTRLISEDKGVVGEITLTSGGPAKFDCDEIAVKDTADLVKALTVLADDVTLVLYPDAKKPKQLRFTDGTSKVHYALADPSIIAQVPTIRNAPDEYEVSIKLTAETKNRFLKSISAFPDSVNFTLTSTKTSVDVTFGDPTLNMNLITFPVEFNRTSDIGKLDFSVTSLKAVLSANSDYEGDPELLVSGEGLAKLEFKTDKITSLYYLVAKSEVDN